MTDAILANLEFIGPALIALIAGCVLMFTSYWTALPFIYVMARWIREDLADLARRIWRRR